jgi:hypothetical protein
LGKRIEVKLRAERTEGTERAEKFLEELSFLFLHLSALSVLSASSVFFLLSSPD